VGLHGVGGVVDDGLDGEVGFFFGGRHRLHHFVLGVGTLVMHLQVLLELEALAAVGVRAHPLSLLSVGLLVSLQGAVLGEVLGAVVAFVRLDARVDAAVSVQGPAGAKILQTSWERAQKKSIKGDGVVGTDPDGLFVVHFIFRPRTAIVRIVLLLIFFHAFDFGKLHLVESRHSLNNVQKINSRFTMGMPQTDVSKLRMRERRRLPPPPPLLDSSGEVGVQNTHFAYVSIFRRAVARFATVARFLKLCPPPAETLLI